MRHILLFACLLFCFLNSSEQTYQKLYTQNQTQGIIKGGLVAGASHNNTAFLLRNTLNIVDSTGTIISSAQMGFNPSLVKPTPDGGFVFASKIGLQYSSLTKSDSVGNILWRVNLSDTSTTISVMRLDNTGNIYLYADSGLTHYVAFLQKYDPNGNLLWSKEMNGYVVSFTTNSAGDILLLGESFVRELNGNGDSLWQRNYTHAITDNPYDIASLPSGDFVVLYTTYYSNYLTSELYEINSTGTLMDSMAVPGTLSSSSLIHLNISADGSIVLYATSYNSVNSQTNASLMDIAPFGQVNWQRSFLGDGHENAYDICALSNGFIISGDTASHFTDYPPNNSAVFIDRLDLSGQYYTPTVIDTSFDTYSASGLIDTNDVAASFSNNGNLFNVFLAPKPPFTSTPSPSAMYVANIWVAGKNNGDLYNSSEEFTSQYQAGPIGTVPDDATKWDNMWKISRSDVLSVKNDFDSHHAITKPVPPSISGWPAKGNPSAAGNNGVALTINQDMAPFYDRNGDGVYNVYDGDYPMMRGDVMLWWINNDAGSQSQSPMGVDRRYSVYEYECPGDSNLNNTVFLSVSIKNQSNRSYDSVTIGAFADMQLGCPNNDRIGSIPSLNSFYAYKGYMQNGTQSGGVTCDDGTLCPTSVGYGCNLPIISGTFLNDTMKCYEYFTNAAAVSVSDPTTDIGYYRYMNGQWDDGSPVTFGGVGYGGTTPYPFAFPGNPADSTQWSECNTQASIALLPGDQRSIAAIGPFRLVAGDTISFDMAFIFHQDSFNNTPDISDSSIVNRHIDSIIRYYATERFPCWYDSSKSLALTFLNVGINDVAANPVFKIIPNPNNGSFNIHFSNTGLSQYSITVTDMLGRVVYYTPFGHSPDQMVQIDNATSGVYSVTIEAENYRSTKKVVITKQ